MTAEFQTTTVDDHVMWFIMEHHDETFIEDGLEYMDLPKNKLQSLYALASEVIADPDKNELHRRIYAGAVADRLEGK